MKLTRYTFISLHFTVSMRPTFYILFIAMAILLASSCANVMSPTGGPRDEKAPVLKRQSVKDSTLNFNGGKISFEFNEFVKLQDLAANFIITPLLKASPKVIAHKKRVSIEIHDSLLEPNTTYHLSLGNAIQDMNESNPYSSMNFTFSTGAYFDSLSLQGTCIEAETGLADTAVLVVLYPASLPDSSFESSRPMYATRVNMGNFRIDNLPNKPFKMYALQDANKNYKYDEGERIAFLDHIVNPKDSISNFVLYTFLEASKLDSSSAKGKGKKIIGRGAEVKKSMKMIYTVNVDTTAKTKFTFNLNDSLEVKFEQKLKSFDQAKIRLFQDQVFDASAVILLDTSKKKISIVTDWNPDAAYTLKLLKGFAIDSNQLEASAAEFKYRTKKRTDYGHITLKVDTASDKLITLWRNAELVGMQYAKDTLLYFNRLLPDNYQVKMLDDKNRNGKWDTGNFVGKKQQPEIVTNVPQAISVKANWENKLDLRQQNDKKPRLKNTR